jgi:hypothetical protein
MTSPSVQKSRPQEARDLLPGRLRGPSRTIEKPSAFRITPQQGVVLQQ